MVGNVVGPDAVGVVVDLGKNCNGKCLQSRDFI